MIDVSASTHDKYFSIDGGVTKIASFSTGLVHGDKYQASHWKEGQGLGLMDPEASDGELLKGSGLDLQMLDVIGWDLNTAGNVKYWKKPGDGPFTSDESWVNGTPGASDTAVFSFGDLGTAQTVTFSSGRTARRLEVFRGDVALDLNGKTFVAQAGGEIHSAKLTVEDGIFRADGEIGVVSSPGTATTAQTGRVIVNSGAVLDVQRIVNESGSKLLGEGSILAGQLVNRGEISDGLTVTGASFANQGTVEAKSGKTLTVKDSVLTNSAGAVLRATGGGVLRLESSEVQLGATALTASFGSRIEYAGSPTARTKIIGGSLAGSGLHQVTGNTTFHGVLVPVGLELDADASTTLLDSTNQGTVRNSAGLLMIENGSNSGDLIVEANTQVKGAWSNTGDVLVDNGALVARNGVSTGGTGTISGHGVLVGDVLNENPDGGLSIATPSGRVDLTTDLDIEDLNAIVYSDASGLAELGPVTAMAGGTLVAPNGLRIAQSDQLVGSGAIEASVLENQGQIITDGLYIEGDYVQTSDGVLGLEISGPTSGQGGIMTVFGWLDLGGILGVSFTGGYAPDSADRLVVLSGLSRTDDFETIDAGTWTFDSFWEVSDDGSTTWLTLTNFSTSEVVPEPSALAGLFGMAAMWLLIRVARRRAAWKAGQG